MSSADSPDSDDDRDQPRTVEPDNVPVSTGISGPFFRAIGRRKMSERDAKILVTAEDAQTGVGKSNLCDFLAYLFDTTEQGFVPEKVSIHAEDFFESYKHVEEGSALVLEEAEQLDSRRHMSQKNVDSSQVWQQERVREVIALLNLPSPKMIDRRMEELADFWINVEARGRARVYEKKIHRIKQSVYYETVQVIKWPNMDGSKSFGEMNSLKMEFIDDDSKGSGWVQRGEMQDKLERAKRETRKQVRDKFLEAIYKETDLTGKEVANLSAVDISRERIVQIVNSDE